MKKDALLQLNNKSENESNCYNNFPDYRETLLDFSYYKEQMQMIAVNKNTRNMFDLVIDELVDK